MIRFLILCVVSVLAFGTVNAEIYKYKDETGRWRFTDKKPQLKDDSSVKKVDYGSSPKRPAVQDKASWVNLAETLAKKYNPRSPVEKATLSVVKVETILGLGSGFFVSDSGHIITNRHVVRPKSSTSWKEKETQLGLEEEYFNESFKRLKREKERLQAMENDLKSYRHEVENPSSYFNPISREQYNLYVRRFNQDENDYKRERKKLKKEHKAFLEMKKKATRQSLNSSFAQNFTIVLKDQQKITAQLIKISQKTTLHY